MSVATELTRIQQAKQDIIDALKTKGINIPSGSTVDEFADMINPYWEESIPDTSVDWSTQYLTFKALESGTFKLSMPRDLTFTSISYSTDSGSTWTTTNYNSGSTLTITTPTITAGNKVLWKGVGNALATSTANTSSFSSTCKFTANGNIMSLLYGDNFSGQVDLTGKDYVFSNLFINAVLLISTVNLKLPATTLATSCYQGMFQGCTSLTTAPELPATTLVSNCYIQMFYSCSRLNYIKAMFTTTPSTSYMNNWVSGVASSGTFVKNAAATWTSSCGVSTYPCNWTVETASS